MKDFLSFGASEIAAGYKYGDRRSDNQDFFAFVESLVLRGQVAD